MLPDWVSNDNSNATTATRIAITPVGVRTTAMRIANTSLRVRTTAIGVAEAQFSKATFIQTAKYLKNIHKQISTKSYQCSIDILSILISQSLQNLLGHEIVLSLRGLFKQCFEKKLFIKF
ncbi:hypothetical protein CEXT_298581 [Caerostris extrusa]|uniref:Uncharacterized protein n=1 Tax=Caerostris extrusa TaxID=172846 RepID=A0AAV4SRQ6_CAEEX|nr:hypothetical protein CEXT_298581 [Caerostris extrusa]